ncbi:tail fiber assembly protein [Providencia manganoxydans]
MDESIVLDADKQTEKYYFNALDNIFLISEKKLEELDGFIEIEKEVYDSMMTLPNDFMVASKGGYPISVPVGSYHFSALQNAFYPYAMQSVYLKAGSWPLDGQLVDESTYYEFAVSEAPKGKQRTANKKGLPAWTDIPKPSQEQLIAEAEQQKQSLLAEANSAIAPLQDAIDLGMATEAETAALQEWKKYRVLLNRVDTSTAPNIDWPEKP